MSIIAKGAIVGDEWEDWERWQEQQNQAHYTNYAPMADYIKSQKWLSDIDNKSRANLSNKTPIAYCFGTFYVFLSMVENKPDRKEYVKILLEAYDSVKGYGRRFFRSEDPLISALRQYVIEDGYRTEKIQKLPLDSYLYPYGCLHAHTVAYFSLSKIIARLALNYILPPSSSMCKMVQISHPVCENAFQKAKFGSYEVSLRQAAKSKRKCMTCLADTEDNMEICTACRGMNSIMSAPGSLDSYFRDRMDY